MEESRRAKRASKKAKRSGPLADVDQEPVDYNRSTPKFCFGFLQPDYDISALNSTQRDNFAMALHNRSKMTWQQIILGGRRGLGQENIAKASIRGSIPSRFVEEKDFIALRYSDRLRMVGTRSLDTFHVLWIERRYGDLYDHGS